MGGVKNILFTDTPAENQYPNEPNKPYFCFMCTSTKSPQDDGCHTDPFDEEQRICTTCYNRHNMLKQEERDDWSYYEKMHGINKE